MNEIDFNSIVAKRVADVSSGKVASLEQASANKVQELTTFRDNWKAQIAASAELNKDAWASETDSAWGTAVNLGASALNRISGMAGDLLAGPTNAKITNDIRDIPDEVLKAHARYKQGMATPEDIEFLNSGGDAPETFSLKEGKESYLKRLESVSSGLKTNKVLNDFFDINRIVHKDDQQKLIETGKDKFAGAMVLADEAGQAYDKGEYFKMLLKGAASAASGAAGVVSSAIKHPQASAEVVASVLPDAALAMLGGRAGIAINSGAAGADMYARSLQTYAEQHDGALPSAKERTKLAAWAASWTAADYVGDRILGGASKASSALGDVLKKPTTQEAAQGFKKALGIVADTIPGRAITGAAKGALGEAGVEAYQSVPEAILEGREATGEDAYVSGMLGAIGGGGLRGSIDVLTGGKPKETNKETANFPPTSEQKAAFEEAVKSGDTKAFTDPKSPTYAPVEGVKALFKNSQEKDKTQEDLDINVQQASAVVAHMESRLDALKEIQEAAKDPSESNQNDLKETRAGLVENLAKVPEDQPNRMALIESSIQDIDLTLEAMNTQGMGKLNARISAAERDTKVAREMLVNMAGLEAAPPSAVTPSPVATTTTTDPEEVVPTSTGTVSRDTEATTSAPVTEPVSQAKRSIARSMHTTTYMSGFDAGAVAEDPNTDLTTQERTYLRNYKAARDAEDAVKSISNVNNDVLFGNPKRGNLGLVDYRAKVGTFLRAGDMVGAAKQLTLLTKFEASHQAKVAAVEAGLKSLSAIKPTALIARVDGGMWQLVDALPNGHKIGDGKTLEISGSSGKLVNTVRAEAKAIEAAGVELESALATFQPTATSASVTTTQAATKPASVAPAAQTQPAAVPEAPLATKTETMAPKKEAKSPIASEQVKVKEAKAVEVAKQDRAEKALIAEQDLATENASSEEITLIQQINSTFTDRTVRSMTADEKAVLDKALDDLGAFAKERTTIKAFLVEQLHDPAAKTMGTFYSNEAVLSFPERLLSGTSKALPGLLAHELAHTRDRLLEAVLPLDNQASWPSENMTTLLPNGDVYQELVASMPANTRLKNTVNYALSYGEGTPTQARELYAVIYSLYYNNTIKEHFNEKTHPTTFAFIQGELETHGESVANDRSNDFSEESGVVSGEYLQESQWEERSPDFGGSDVHGGRGLEAPSEIAAAVAELQAATGYLQDADAQTQGAYIHGLMTWAENYVGFLSETAQSLPTKEQQEYRDVIQQAKSLALDAAQKLWTAPAEGKELQPGKLSALDRVTNAGTTFHERNQIADHFTQSPGKEGSKSLNPLAKVGSFITALVNGSTKVTDFLEENTKAAYEEDTDQRFAVHAFVEKAKKWGGMIQAGLVKPVLVNPNDYKEGYKYALKDFMKYLVDPTTGTLEENITTAMSLGMYNYVVDTAHQSRLADDKRLNTLLGKPEDNYEFTVAEESARTWGYLLSSTKDSLGTAAYNALGLQIKQTAPANFKAQLTNALGTHMMNVLHQDGYLQVTTKTSQEMADLLKDAAKYTPKTTEALKDAAAKREKDGWNTPIAVRTDEANIFEKKLDRKTFQFVQLTQGEGKWNYSPKVEAIKHSVAGSQSILNKLFNTQKADREPSREPVTKQHNFAKGTRQGVPAAMVAAMDKLQNTPNYLRGDMWHLVNSVSQDTMLKIMGSMSTDPTDTHISQRRSNEAKNDGLFRELTGFMGFVNNSLAKFGEVTEQPMYLTGSVWVQQRGAFANTVMNPQTSKLARQAMTRKDWESTINLDGSEESATLLTSFLLRIAEGLGVKTENGSVDSGLGQVQALRKDEKIEAAIKLLQDNVYGPDPQPLTDMQQAVLLAAVDKGGEGVQSLAALMALAQYEQAIANKATSFTTTMAGEIDGKTNGPMLSQFVFGGGYDAASLAQMLAKGGFYTLGTEVSQYHEWVAKPGNMDLYQGVAANIMARLGGGFPKEFEYFTGVLQKPDGSITSAGRNMTKEPITALHFGSAMASATRSMATGFMASVVKKIASGEKDGVPLQELVSSINVLMDKGSHHISVQSYQELRDLVFSKAQTKAITGNFFFSTKDAIEGALGDSFGRFLQTRDSMNMVTNAAYNIYKATYEAMREQFVATEIEAGRVEVTQPKGTVTMPNPIPQPTHELTGEQEARFAEMMKGMAPVIRTPMSKEDGAGLDLENGMLLARTDTITDTNPHYQSRVDVLLGRKKTSQSNYAAHPVESEPGVRGVSTTVHSGDSYISHKSEENVLNIHDAHFMGLGRFTEAGLNLNKNTWEMVSSYSPMAEARDMLERVLEGAAALAEGNPKVVENIGKVLEDLAKKEEMSTEAVLSAVVGNAVIAAYQADQMRLTLASQMEWVDQYPTHGGSYEVSSEQRDMAKTELDALSKDVSPKMNEALKSLLTRLGHPTETTTKPGLGKPLHESDPVLVKLFEDQGSPDVSLVTTAMAKVFKNDPVNSALLKRVVSQLPFNLSFSYITADNDTSQEGSEEATSRGWYDPKTQTVYVRSPDFVHSGLSAELLLHEIFHSVLSSAIEQGLKGEKIGNRRKPVTILVDELNSILKRAQEFVAKEGLTETFAAAVSSVHELVSWGMTNKAFQEQVLRKVKMPVSKSLKNTLVTAMKKFVDSLSNFLFPGTSLGQKEVLSSGLYQLMQNTAGLMEFAKEQNDVDSMKEMDLFFMASVAPDPSTFTTAQVFDALGQMGPNQPSAAFSEHLSNILNNIAGRVFGPQGTMSEEAQKYHNLAAQDAYLAASLDGKPAFALEAKAAGFVVSEREAFVMDQVAAAMEAALNDGKVGSTYMATDHLSKVYKEAYAQFGKPSSSATAEEKAMLEFVFKIKDSTGKSAHLSRFVAMALGHEGFNSLLGGVTLEASPSTSKGTIATRIRKFFEGVLNAVGNRMTNTFEGQKANSKVQTLAQQLVNIEAKRKQAYARRQKGNVIERMQNKGDDVLKSGLSKLSNFAHSPFVERSNRSVFRAGVKVLNQVAQGRTEILLEGMAKIRDEHNNGKLGLIAGLLKELRHPVKEFQLLLMGTKNLERTRKFISTETSKFVRQGFVNEGKDLSEKNKKTITNVLLRTGSHVLLDSFSDKEMQTLFSDSQARSTAIVAAEAAVASYPHGRYYRNQSRALAHSLVVGGARGLKMMTNAGNIANMYTMKAKHNLSETQLQEATLAIDKLTSLYALQYTSAADLKEISEIMAKEMARPVEQGNGIMTTMYQHKALENDAREKLFAGQEALMMKGYLPEILDPYTELQAVPVGPEMDALTVVGYANTGPLPKDKADPDKTERFLMVREGAGLMPYLSGILSLKGMKAKGSAMHGGNLSTLTEDGKTNLAMLQAANRNMASIELQLLTGDYDPLTDDDVHMAPVLSPNGEVTNYRYMMSHHRKNSLLQRDNAFDTLLGSLASNTFDKESAVVQNQKTVKELRDMYLRDYKDNPRAYMTISPNSQDPELRELYQMLPKALRDDIKKVWGTDSLTVRNDLMDMVFGYRKLSVTNMFAKPEAERSMMEMAFTWSVEHALEQYAKVYLRKNPQEVDAYVKQAYVKVAQGERMWQEVVGAAKDTIVIKTVSVMFNNIVSNVSLLKMAGVPLLDIVKHHRVAIKATRQWNRDSSALFALEQQLATSTAQGKAVGDIKRNIALLHDALEGNPVKALIDAGLMPSIVEDVGQDDAPFSYKSKLTKLVEEKAANLNPKVLGAAKAVYMSKGGDVYQALNEITQMSDFVARYTLYQHLTTKNKPDTHEQAVLKASDYFINYDVPMHRTMQYTDDLGLTMFTKYFLRIQRVLASIARDQPTNVMGMMLFSELADVSGTVLESGAWTRMGNNPLHMGALAYPSSLSQLATVQGAMGLLK